MIKRVKKIAHITKPLEKDIQQQILAMVKMHPKVALIWRQNTGAMKLDNRYVRFGFPGISDLLGFTTNGRIICLEVKRKGEHPTPQQGQFLGMVRTYGGIAAVVHGAQEAWNVMERA